MGLMLNERCNADEIAKKMTFRDACAAHESDGIKALRLASWEATVLPLLRRAMAEHPELRDARVKLERDGGDATFEVKLHGGNWDHSSWPIRRHRGRLRRARGGRCRGGGQAPCGGGPWRWGQGSMPWPFLCTHAMRAAHAEWPALLSQSDRIRRFGECA